MNGDRPSIVPTAEGPTVLYRDRFLYPKTSPESGSKRRAASIELLPRTLYVLASPLLFYGVDTLLERLPPDSSILAIETDQALMALTSEWYKPFSGDRVAYVRTESAERVLEWLRGRGVWRYRRAQLVTLSGGYLLDTATYSAFISAIEGEIRTYWRNRMTLVHMSRLWIRNIISNLPYIAAAGDAGDLALDSPLFVAGAGESLEESLPVLERLGHRLPIVAVDTALPVLLRSGIVPRFVVALEGQAANLRDFIGSGGSGFSLLWDITSYPGAVHLAGNESYAFTSHFADNRLLERMSGYGILPSVIPPLGSVGIAAVYIALRMTSHPVIFAGLDFSYVPGKTHARGSPTHLSSLTRSCRLRPASATGISPIGYPVRKTGKDGRTYVSDLVLYSYGERLAEIAGAHSRLYDFGKSGLSFGCRRLETAEELENILDIAGDGISAPIERGIDFSRRAAVSSFVENEIEHLEKAIDVARTVMGGDSDPEDLAVSVLSSVDYVYLHFPDTTPMPGTDRGFLERFTRAAVDYRERLKRITAEGLPNLRRS